MVFKMERYILPALTEPGQRLAVGDCHLLGYDPRGRREWVPPPVRLGPGPWPRQAGTPKIARSGRVTLDKNRSNDVRRDYLDCRAGVEIGIQASTVNQPPSRFAT